MRIAPIRIMPIRIMPIAAAAALTVATAFPAAAQGRSMVYDTDGDGTLTQSEFTSGPMNLGNFNRFDRNNDGGVDVGEFMRGLADRLSANRDSGTATPMDLRDVQIAVMMFN